MLREEAAAALRVQARAIQAREVSRVPEAWPLEAERELSRLIAKHRAAVRCLAAGWSQKEDRQTQEE